MALDPVLVNRRRAAEMLSISERSLFSLTKAGVIPVVKLGEGRTIRYSVKTLQERVAQLQSSGAQA